MPGDLLPVVEIDSSPVLIGIDPHHGAIYEDDVSNEYNCYDLQGDCNTLWQCRFCEEYVEIEHFDWIVGICKVHDPCLW